VTRWLWIWFFAFIAFPVAMAPKGVLRVDAVPAATSAPAVASTHGAWGGPLAPVLDRLEWVDGRRVPSAQLAGRVAVVEYWTFACVNCRRTLPAMRELSRRFHDGDVRVLSIHTPELDFEHDPRQVTAAVRREGIPYPVALDPDGKAWDAIGNRYWPCLYLLDGSGQVRYRHVGELHEGTPDWTDLLQHIESLRTHRS
jgi:thiol-disulfide isomerase/thioredoxin